MATHAPSPAIPECLIKSLSPEERHYASGQTRTHWKQVTIDDLLALLGAVIVTAIFGLGVYDILRYLI